MTTSATLWFRIIVEGGTQREEFNHLEEKAVPIVQIRPTPKSDDTKLNWGKGTWRAEPVSLTDTIPQRVIRLI